MTTSTPSVPTLGKCPEPARQELKMRRVIELYRQLFDSRPNDRSARRDASVAPWRPAGCPSRPRNNMRPATKLRPQMPPA